MASVRCEILPTTGSTQDVARQRRSAGRRAPFVVATGDQRRGRGRLGRPWVSAPGDSLALTLVHRSSLPAERRSWYPLAAGLGAIAALSDLAPDLPVLGGPASAPGRSGGREDPAALGLKWPNDLHTRAGRKLGGILIEGDGAEHVLLGIGLNLRGPVRDGRGAEVAHAAWLHGPGGLLGDTGEETPLGGDLGALADAIASRMHTELEALDDADGDALASGIATRYHEICVTVGQEVQAYRAEDSAGNAPTLRGIAEGVDPLGRLLVRDQDGHAAALSVGDVRHLRPAPLRPTTTPTQQETTR